MWLRPHNKRTIFIAHNVIAFGQNSQQAQINFNNFHEGLLGKTTKEMGVSPARRIGGVHRVYTMPKESARTSRPSPIANHARMTASAYERRGQLHARISRKGRKASPYKQMTSLMTTWRNRSRGRRIEKKTSRY